MCYFFVSVQCGSMLTAGAELLEEEDPSALWTDTESELDPVTQRPADTDNADVDSEAVGSSENARGTFTNE